MASPSRASVFSSIGAVGRATCVIPLWASILGLKDKTLFHLFCFVFQRVGVPRGDAHKVYFWLEAYEWTLLGFPLKPTSVPQKCYDGFFVESEHLQACVHVCYIAMLSPYQRSVAAPTWLCAVVIGLFCPQAEDQMEGRDPHSSPEELMTLKNFRQVRTRRAV